MKLSSIFFLLFRRCSTIPSTSKYINKMRAREKKVGLHTNRNIKNIINLWSRAINHMFIWSFCLGTNFVCSLLFKQWNVGYIQCSSVKKVCIFMAFCKCHWNSMHFGFSHQANNSDTIGDKCLVKFNWNTITVVAVANFSYAFEMCIDPLLGTTVTLIRFSELFLHTWIEGGNRWVFLLPWVAKDNKNPCFVFKRWFTKYFSAKSTWFTQKRPNRIENSSTKSENWLRKNGDDNKRSKLI